MATRRPDSVMCPFTEDWSPRSNWGARFRQVRRPISKPCKQGYLTRSGNHRVHHLGNLASTSLRLISTSTRYLKINRRTDVSAILFLFGGFRFRALDVNGKMYFTKATTVFNSEIRFRRVLTLLYAPLVHFKLAKVASGLRYRLLFFITI